MQLTRNIHLNDKGKMVLTATKKDRANNHTQDKALPFLVANRYVQGKTALASPTDFMKTVLENLP